MRMRYPIDINISDHDRQELQDYLDTHYLGICYLIADTKRRRNYVEVGEPDFEIIRYKFPILLLDRDNNGVLCFWLKGEVFTLVREHEFKQAFEAMTELELAEAKGE